MFRKSILLLISLILILSTALIGCGNQQDDVQEAEGNQDPEVVEEEKLVIYTSMYPLYDFTKKIAGEKAEVVNLIPSGAEPHDFEPTSKDIMNLSQANLFIYNGGGFESWIEKIAEAVNNPVLTLVDSTEHISLLSNEDTGHIHHDDEDHGHGKEEDHGHGQEHSKEEDHDHDHGDHEEDHDDDQHDHNDHGEFDPHVWIDPNLAKQQAEAIKNALVEMDQANADYYENNFVQLAAQFAELDAKYKEVTQHIKRRDFVVSHAAFSYLALRYELNQVAIAGLNLEEPSTKQLQDIIRFIKENEIEYILFENLVTPKVAEVVKEDVGAESLVLHNLEGLTEEELSQGKDYFSIMEDNLEVLKKALGYTK